MLPGILSAEMAELETMLSSAWTGCRLVSGLSELELFGRRTRLLLFAEPDNVDGYGQDHTERARHIALTLDRHGVTPVLVTANTGSQLATNLRDAGWGVMSATAKTIELDGVAQPAIEVTPDPPDVPAHSRRQPDLLCALWQFGNRHVTASDLAAAAEVSPPVARRFLARAVAAGWMSQDRMKQGHAFMVENKSALVDLFLATATNEPDRWQCFRVRPDIFASLPERLIEFCGLNRVRYVTTGRYAASHYLARQQDASELLLRMEPSISFGDLLAHLRATPCADVAANLKIMVSLETANWLFKTRRDGFDLANPLVVASDLARTRDPLAAVMVDWLCRSMTT